MEFTGERFVPEVHGEIELEHLHRYYLAKEIVQGKIVLDIASGEGYGSHMLSQVASKVFGVDISLEAVNYAKTKYQYKVNNLEFLIGSCAAIPLEDKSVDVIVSFETIEHHDEHEAMMREIKRVLKPNGCLLISSPDKFEYSDKPAFKNEHHVKELYRDEFEALIKRNFNHYHILGQKMTYGSAIVAENLTSKVNTYQYTEGVEGPFNGIKNAVYLIAIASDDLIPDISSGLLEQPINNSSVMQFWKNTVEQLQSEVGKFKQIILEKDSQIENYVQAVAGRDNEIINLTNNLALANSRYTEYDSILAASNADRSEAIRQLVAHDQSLTESRKRLTEQEQHIAESTKRLAEQEQRLADSSKRLAEQEQHMADSSKRLAEQEQHMAESSKRLAEQEQHMAESSKRLAEQEQHMHESSKRLDFSSEQLATLQQQLMAMNNSSSWRLTTPFRFLSRQLKRAPVAVRLALPAIKLGGGISNTMFKALNLYKREGIPGIKRGFRMVATAQHAKQAVVSQKTDNVVVVQGVAETPQKQFLTAGANPELKTADGVWEWQAYGEVKSRIEKFKTNRAQNLILNPVRIVNTEGQDLIKIAQEINLPLPNLVPTISIILPVFNNIRLTIECLISIANSDNTVNYEIIIADDCSTDDTSKILKFIKNVKYFRNEINLGFLRNTNKALQYVTGKYVLYLNNDVQVTGSWLSTLLATFKSRPKIGAVGPKFIYPSGHLQEAGAAFNIDGTAEMIGLNESPQQARFSYIRRVDYISGACLLIPTELVKSLGGFSEEFLPCYCEDSDLCLRIQAAGYYIYCNPNVTVMHHLSKSTDTLGESYKLKCVYKNVTTLKMKWQDHLQKVVTPKIIAFYLPQFHPFPENNQWWGHGFTEWTNVAKTKPNFVGHYQPRYPADLGYYDLRLPQILAQQAALAQRYGVSGFCFYYYWFDGDRLLEQPLEQMLKSKEPDFPFCLCWANENWTRRWDGLDHEVLMAQAHSPKDDVAVIEDLIRYFKDDRYIRIDGRPLLLVYRVALFPNFIETAARWREICRSAGVGEIYLSSVESFDGVNENSDPASFGCDAAVEFPPHGMGEAKPVPGALLNPNFNGTLANYNDIAVRFATRASPDYTRFRSVMPGWDNTARRQDTSFCFDQSSPGAFQAWLEESLEQTRLDRFGDEKLVFLNAWNEWAEGAYLEPDKRFGHTYLEAVSNALDSKQLKS
jgi:O-antigen biosynthesis protein